MEPSGTFLAGKEAEDFQKADRVQPRYVVASPITPSLVRPTPEELTSSVAGRLSALSYKQGKWFGCYCVAVRADDGMSWSAEAVAQKLRASFPSYEVKPLARDMATDSLPHIVQLLGERDLMKAAVRHKLAKWYPTLYLSHAPLILAGVFLLGALITVLQALVKLWSPSTASQSSQLFNPWLLGMSGSLAVLAILAKFLGDPFSAGRKDKSIAEFVGKLPALESQGEDSAFYVKFVEDVAKTLEWEDKPRIVVVDNYERLDITTRHVLQRYLQSYVRDASGSEFWVVFESTDGPGLSKLVQQDRSSYDYALKDTSFFRQELLSDAALLQINRFLGRDEMPLHKVVKWVVRGGAEQTERIFSALEAFATEHPVEEGAYGQLEFFYFLSLAASPGNIEFSRNSLSSALSRKDLARSDVLKRILPGTRLNKGQFQGNIDTTAQSFKQFVTSKEGGGDNVVGFSSEVAQVFEEKAGKLELSRPALIHLYWALYWFDDSQNRPDDAYRLRKLSHHVLQTNLDTVLSCSLTRKYFDAVLYAIRGSLRVCIFKDLGSLVKRLVETFNALEVHYQRQPEGVLLALCWDIYNVTGDENVSAYVSQVQTAPPSPSGAAEVSLLDNRLAELFLATAIPASRSALREVFPVWIAQDGKGKNVNHQSALRNAYARAGWLMCSLMALASWNGVEGTFLANPVGDLDKLKLLFRETRDRMYGDGSTLPLFTDVMTLSLCLWSIALMEWQLRREEGMKELVELAHEALIVATKLKDEAKKSAETEILMIAVVREVTAVALGCLLLVYQLYCLLGSEPAPDSKIHKLMRERHSLIDSGISARWGPGKDTFSGWIEDVDALFAQSAVIWTRFELEKLRDFAQLRRLQFNVFCRTLPPDDRERFLPLQEAASPILSSPGYAGILGNCVVATCYRPAAELCAEFVYQAANRALEDQMADSLQFEIAMLLVEKAHAFNFDLGPFLEILTRADGDGHTALRNFLAAVSEASFPSYALHCLNAIASSDNPSVANTVVRVIREMTGLLTLIPERTEVESLLQYHDLQQRLKRGGSLPAAEQLLAQWTDRKHLWVYAGILRLFITQRVQDSALYEQACEALQHDASKDTSSGFLQLALELGQHAPIGQLQAKERNTIARYIREAIPNWEHRVSVDTNLAAYRVLLMLDSSRQAEYLAREIRWENIKIERDHRRRLRELARQEKYLLIFRDYFESATFWGLRPDCSEEEWEKYANADLSRKSEILQQWLAEGAHIPSPITSREGPLISGRFLWIGRYLFSPPNDKDPALKPYQEAFNRTAKDSLADLLEGILRLPHMPEEIRALLGHYSGELLKEAGLRRMAARKTA